MALSLCSCSGVRRARSRSAASELFGHREPGFSAFKAAPATSPMSCFSCISAGGKPLWPRWLTMHIWQLLYRQSGAEKLVQGRALERRRKQ